MRSPALLAALLLSTVLARAPQRAPDAGPGIAGTAPSNRPPYPEVWDPHPLRFPYAAAESLYLSPAAAAASPSPESTSVSAKPARSFDLSPLLRRDIRVLLQAGAASFQVTARGGADVQWRRPDGQPLRGPRMNGNVKVERRNARFQITPASGSSVNIPGDAVLRLAPIDANSPLEINGKAYRGALEFHPDGSGLQCVNTLGLEQYLRGVVPLEMGRAPETSLEALKAQAVVARSYSLKRMMARNDQIFDLYASVQDQVYGGVPAEYAVSDRAVRATEGQVLLHADTIAVCYYHSTCGGVTASRHEVWGGPRIAYLISSPDRDADGRPWCKASRYLDWTESWDAGDLAGIVRRNLPAAGVSNSPAFKRITGIRVTDRFSDGRISALEIATDKGTVVLRGDKIRFALKPGNGAGRVLESDRFDIRMDGDRVTAHGSGYGHGVGMCQMGALARSQAGQSYAEILAAYYPGTSLAVIGEK